MDNHGHQLFLPRQEHYNGNEIEHYLLLYKRSINMIAKIYIVDMRDEELKMIWKRYIVYKRYE